MPDTERASHSDLREKVAWASQNVWNNWHEPVTFGNYKEVRLAAADVAIAVCMEEAARVVRECFYDPEAEADPDHIPAAIRSLIPTSEAE